MSVGRSRQLSIACVLIAILGVQSGGAANVRYHEALDPKILPVPESLVPAIEFWRDIFARYGTNEVVLHDDRHLEVVYSVVDVSDLYDRGLSDLRISRLRRDRVDQEIDRIEAALRHLGGETRVRADADLLATIPALMSKISGGKSKYRQAVRRIRPQTGQRERFEEAIEISGMFMADIEEILARRGVPGEISHLPFIESMFNYKARSKVGASGAWQFTRGAAVEVMRVDAAVDERSDVLLAAEGAAKKLAREYDRLGSWPLTLTGYNHGVNGMARAAKSLGTKDIGEIVKRWDGRSFGFASRNFYAEFVAVVTAYADREELLPNARPRPRIRFDVLTPGTYVSLHDLSLITDVDLATLEDLNPALSEEVIRGNLLVPADYPLRVPAGRGVAFQSAYDLLPADRKPSRQLAVRHRVRPGETLGALASRYGSSVRAIQSANNLPRADRIFVGQQLEIPNGGGRLPPLDLSALRQASQTATTAASEEGEPTVADPAAEEAAVHIVTRGESLSRIAQLYGVGVDALASANGLARAATLHPGQKLNVPDGGVVQYRVRSGDTLSRIAERHGTTVREIIAANRLRSTVIRIGQLLHIPVS